MQPSMGPLCYTPDELPWLRSSPKSISQKKVHRQRTPIAPSAGMERNRKHLVGRGKFNDLESLGLFQIVEPDQYTAVAMLLRDFIYGVFSPLRAQQRRSLRPYKRTSSPRLCTSERCPISGSRTLRRELSLSRQRYSVELGRTLGAAHIVLAGGLADGTNGASSCRPPAAIAPC